LEEKALVKQVNVFALNVAQPLEVIALVKGCVRQELFGF
jgi:hypothetical protein